MLIYLVDKWIEFKGNFFIKIRGKADNRQQEKTSKGGFSGAASSQGMIIEPHVAIVVSLLYVGVVIILHMIGKYRKETTVA